MARPTLFTNRKFAKLARILGSRPLALGYLEFLWHAANECGNPVVGDADDVEALAHWDGEPGELVKALTGCGSAGGPGFLIDAGGGLYEIHDYWHHAPDYVRKRADRESQRRAHGYSLDRNGLPRSVVKEIFDTHPRECALCGAQGSLEIDHIVATARGGTNDIENLRLLCRRCNRTKGATADRSDRSLPDTSEKRAAVTRTPSPSPSPSPHKTATAAKAAHSEPPEFAELWQAFPKRSGSNPRSRAFKAVRARLREGATWEALIAGARRYRTFVEATGKGQTEFVMQAATFFGPDKHFLNPWHPPPRKFLSPVDRLRQELKDDEERHERLVN